MNERIAEVRKTHEIIIAMIDKYGDQFGLVIADLPKDVVVNTWADTLEFNLAVAGDRHEFAAAIRALRVNGFKTDDAPPAKNAPSWSGHFKHITGARMYLSFTSRACRRVKVGTRTIEEDVYETVCDETHLPESAASARA